MCPAVEDHRQLHVRDRIEVGQQVARRLLPDHADDSAPVARPLPAAEAAEVVVRHDRLTRGRQVLAAEDVQQG